MDGSKKVRVSVKKAISVPAVIAPMQSSAPADASVNADEYYAVRSIMVERRAGGGARWGKRSSNVGGNGGIVARCEAAQLYCAA